ncbi:MAG: hypothetical protein HYX97_04795, partial [Chloroflexi bacterium]|nr:hypothetical protein [Chloroflexota bacterium]
MSQKPSKTGQRKKLEIIPYLPQEMDEFDAEIARYQRGEVLDNKFIPYRLVRG